MKRTIYLILIALIVAGVRLSFAEEKRVDSASDAILYTEALESKAEKATYLLHHAEQFFGQKKYRDAKEVVLYVLESVDKKSEEAQEMLVKIKKKIEEETMEKVHPVEVNF